MLLIFFLLTNCLHVVLHAGTQHFRSTYDGSHQILVDQGRYQPIHDKARIAMSGQIKSL